MKPKVKLQLIIVNKIIIAPKGLPHLSIYNSNHESRYYQELELSKLCRL